VILAGIAVVALCAQSPNDEYRTAELRRKAITEMEHPIRPKVERTDVLVRSLGIRAGETVADIGGGSGYLLPHLVAAAGPHGAVIVEDIHDEFLAHARRKAAAAGWGNVRTVLGTAVDPGLPAGTVDTALVLDAYHHFDHPRPMLDQIWAALKPGGRLLVVDYYRSRKHPGAADADLKRHIRADRDDVIREVTERRFRLVRHFDHLPHEYVLTFVK
jgi:ubiquinone/menaquinone biosynthesis C-methylase UbiE